MVKGDNLGKSYGDKLVFKHVDIEIERGNRVAFVGQNGQGKSTLVKIITTNLAHNGNLEMGHNVQIGYYAQDQADSLDGDKTVLATIEDAADEDTRKRARDLLGSFMFSGEDVDKKVKVLSGGERGRLAMCKLMLQPINLLVMDEPTNHLDMRAKDVLKQALQQYDGTLLVVSHDREFLHGLADRVYEFREGKVKPYLGGIEFFLEQRKLNNMRMLEKRAEEKETEKTDKATKGNYKERKELEKQLRKTQNQLQKAEAEIEQHEAHIKALDEALMHPEKFKELSKDPDYFEKYEKDKQRLEALMLNWETLGADLDAIQAKLDEMT